MRYVDIRQSPCEVAAAFHKRDHFAFLDSSRNDAEQGRYSILAWDPKAVLRTGDDDPFARLDTFLDTPSAAAIGYFSYDLFRFLEPYESLKAADDLHLPGCSLALYDVIAVFDHHRGVWTFEGESEEKIERRVREIERAHAPDSSERWHAGPAESNLSPRDYKQRVERALHYIAAGDIYQVNLSQRWSHRFEGSAFGLFSKLREVTPSFYGAYLNCGNHAVISSSPELFLRREGSMIETRPVKGTRPRGKTKEQDAALEQELLDSKKEAAELTMIVDLERNDLGRISEYGTVEVMDHRYVDRLPTVFHTASIVRGRLRANATVTDILRATFPGGSISGCPKIRSIEIIDELEPVRRHVYTGAIGMIRPNGDLALNVAIRTMTVANGRVYYHAGGGIVSDSIPEKEYDETLHKAVGMQRALASFEPRVKNAAERVEAANGFTGP